MPTVPSLSIHGAGQVLRPPEDGLPLLRHDRAGEQTLHPGAVRVEGGRIAGFQPDPRAPVQVDAGGGAVVPGLVDCHTHLPFAGWRAPDPRASDAAVLRQSRELAAEMLRDGTTAFEARGGSPAALRLAARLGGIVRQTVVSSAAVAEDELAAAVAESRARALALEAGDVRLRGGEAAAHDLWLRVDTAEAVLPALALGARSVDGLTGLRPGDVAALAEAACACVLLPVEELLHAEQLSPARALADAGAVCALATGCHPTRAPVASLPLAIGLAARLYGWDAREALLACTLNAAWVLGLHDRLGSIEAGKHADLLVLDSPVEDLPHRLGRSPVAVVVRSGEVVWVRPDQAWRVVDGT
jgi:imidazolonepropionase